MAPTSSSSAIPASGKRFSPKSSRGAPARPINVCCCSLRPWTCSIICRPRSLVRKLKIYTEPSLLVCDELGYLSLDQHTSNLFYTGHLHAPQPQAKYSDHDEYCV